MDFQNDFLKIERQIAQTNSKIDDLYKMINLLCNDLGVTRGTRMYDLMDHLKDQMQNISREIDPREMKTISYQVQNIKNSLDKMNRKELY